MVSPGPLDTPIYGRATSATGFRPATLPDAYDADEIAKALVNTLVKPRHDRIVGGESKLITLLYETVRPAGELVLVFVDRWYRTGTDQAASPGSLWSANEHAQRSDGHHGRRNGDLIAFGCNLWRAAQRTVRIAPQLMRPVPERPPVAPSEAPDEALEPLSA
jgi:hypothetical protein